jgi:hypothetical protein
VLSISSLQYCDMGFPVAGCFGCGHLQKFPWVKASCLFQVRVPLWGQPLSYNGSMAETGVVVKHKTWFTCLISVNLQDPRTSKGSAETLAAPTKFNFSLCPILSRLPPSQYHSKNSLQ